MLSLSSSLDDYDDSPPPPPPRTLEDQVYVAYAHDDIHRAKILLLKLKGIDVTSDNDPRIAAVQDEDFDFCFIPNGKLITEEEERAMMEAQRREQKRRQREERLRACEYIWEHAKRRMREDRLWLQRRRELEERRRAAEEAERLRALAATEVPVNEPRPPVARPRIQRRNVVSYDTLARSSSQPPCNDPFVYDIMVHPSSARSTPSSSPRRSQLSTPCSSPPKHSPSHLQTTRPTLHEGGCRSVSFKDVAASLDGPLFPLTTEERQRRMSVSGRSKSCSPTRDHQRQKQAALMDSLLSVSEWDGAEHRLRKGKAREVDLHSPCGQCSIQIPALSTSASSSSISSCPSLTRSNSWLSFVSRSPDSFSPPLPPLIPAWLKRSRCTACCNSRRRHLQRVPVSISDTPLHLGARATGAGLALTRREKHSAASRRQHLIGAANVVAQSFGQLLEAAKQFQRAYMMVAVYNAAELNNSNRGENDYDYWNKKRAMAPAGTRARSKDVQAFLAGVSLASEKATQYIPLLSPFPPKFPPRTVLPNPLPYPVVFKPHPPISRSPFRLQQKQSSLKLACHALDRLPSEPHGEAHLRVRFVSNPAYLRLRALDNIIYDRGVNWEGRGRGCGFSSGKETLPSIAIDGLGRSLLSAC